LRLCLQKKWSIEEGEDLKVGKDNGVWKDNGHSFLGCTRYNSYRLPSVETNDQWRLLRSFIGFNNILKKKRPHFLLAKKNVLFHQDNARVHVPSIDDQIQRIPLRTASPSSIFARFSLLRISCYQIWRNSSEERDSPPESRSSSPKQRLILKGWANHIIRTAWKSWRIVRSSVSSWKDTMMRNKNESIKKNVFYYVFLKTNWLVLINRKSNFIISFYKSI